MRLSLSGNHACILACRRLFAVLLCYTAWGLIAPSFLQAQTTNPIRMGQWQSHQCYIVAKTLAQAGQLIYVGTDAALYSYDKQSSEIATYTKVEGFSDLNIKYLAYDPLSEQLMILYANNNIDFYKNGKITNFRDLQNADIGTTISVNSLTTYEGNVYLATNIGIIVLDLQAREVKDTYIIGAGGERVPVYQVAINADEIVAATPNGLLSANRNTDLWNYNNWQLDPQLTPNQVVWNAAYLNGQLYAEIADNQLYRRQTDGTWDLVLNDAGYTIKALRPATDRLMVVQRSNNGGRIAVITATGEVSYIDGFYMPQPTDIIADEQGDYWIADEWESLLRRHKEGWTETIHPVTPRSNAGFRLYHRQGELWVAAGNADHKFDGAANSTGENYEGAWRLKEGEWQTFNQYSVPTMPDKPNVLSIAFDAANPDRVFLGTLYDGLLQLDVSQNLITDLSPQLRPLQNLPEDEAVRIAAIQTDDAGNIWMSGILSPAPLMLRQADGDFKSFRFAQVQSGESNRFSEIAVDDLGQVWMLQIHAGVLVFDPANYIDNSTATHNVSAADYRILTAGEGKGNLPGNAFYAIAKDRDGYIWVGTDDGIAVYHCPYSVLTTGCDAFRPYIEQDGLGAYLLQNERVTSIAVDAANRKWVGTASGLWLFSPDGTKTIHHFTTQNSPLLSNYITHVAIDDQSGMVYIATNQGIIAYKSDAIAGEAGHGEVVVYPNPVRPDYAGDIAIKGLPQDAIVKITDVAGNLVYETRSLGGQAIWNGKDYTGSPAASGIYLVFSSDPTGVQHQVNKIAIVR